MSAWTPAELSFLRKNYVAMGLSECAQRLNRPLGSVRNKAYHLRLKPSRPWTFKEEAVLHRWYAQPILEWGFLDQLADRLGRTRISVALHASRLGLTRPDAKHVAEPHRQRVGRNHRGYVYKSVARFATAAERGAFQSAQVRRWLAEHGHPRGTLGMKHTPATLAKMRAASLRAWRNPASGLNAEATRQRRSDLMAQRQAAGLLLNGESVYSRCKSGRRVDLDGRFFRSAWEANYARYLNWLIQQGHIQGWQYECHTFWFDAIKRGVRSYTPDFKVTYADGSHEWHEVKGWMDPKSRTKLDRMTRYFPTEHVVVIDKVWFQSIRRQGLTALLPYWEGRR